MNEIHAVEMQKALARRRSKQLGQAASEYIIVLVLIAVVCIGLIGAVGDSVKEMWDTTSTQVESANSHSTSSMTTIN